MTPEPHWTAYLSALLAPTIAVLGAWIAYRQWRLGQNKLKLDLFDRRFKVYDGARELLGTVYRSGSLKFEDLLRYRNATREAKWLFSAEVDKYLVEILYPKAVKLAQLEAELEGVGVGEERTENVRQQRELKDWLVAQEAALDGVFSRFLRLAAEA